MIRVGILGDTRKPENPPLQVQDARPTPLKKTKRTHARRATQAQVPYVARKVAGFHPGSAMARASGTKTGTRAPEFWELGYRGPVFLFCWDVCPS